MAPERDRRVRCAAILAALSLGGCTAGMMAHPERQIFADCNKNSWLWKDSAGAFFVGASPDLAVPIAPGANLAQICPRLLEKAQSIPAEVR